MVEAPEDLAQRTRVAWRRVVGGLLCAAGGVALALGLYSTHTTHFQPQTHRVLAELALASSIRVELHPRKSSGIGIITGVLFPRENDGKLAFDGRISYESVGEQYNFTLVDGRGFVTVEDAATGRILRNDCLKKANVPPIHELTDALRGARVIDDATAVGVAATACDGGQLIEFVFAGEPYVICSLSDTSINEIHGDDIKATLQLLKDGDSADGEDLSVDMLTRPDAQPLDECELLDGDDDDNDSTTRRRLSVTDRFTHALKHSQDVWAVLRGQRRLASSNKCDTECKGGKKACLFVHGLGKKLDAPLADTYPEYWGKIHEDVHCCTQTKFVRMDTVNTPWYADSLAKKVCDAAVSMTTSQNHMQLENIAIISHSMGNLIVSSAVMKNLCAVGPTSKWIALAGPIIGSKSANVGVESCTLATKAVGKDTIDTLTSTNMCPAHQSTSSLVFKQTEEASQSLDKLYDQARSIFGKYVTASMCGVSTTGLASKDAVKYTALALISNHGSDSDGAVEINSCRGPFPEENYKTSWQGGRFYKAGVNHGDAALRHGDGWWGDDRKPVKWLNCQF